VEQAKLISVTVVLTLLIWATAHQLVSSTHEIDVTIVPQPVEGSALIVRTDPSGLDRFRLTVTGPKRIVDRVREEAQAGQLQPLVIPVHDSPNGRYPVDVRRALSDYRDQLRGLQVERVQPSEVMVVIDHLETVRMPVQIEHRLDYDVAPQAEPNEVSVTIPQSQLEKLGQRRVVLKGDELFRDRPEGQPQEIPGVVLPTRLGGAEVRMEPATVTVRGTLRKQSKTDTIPAVPITFQGSAENLNRFEVQPREPEPITRAITVQGPPAVVDALVDGRRAVSGRVVLTGDLAARAGELVEVSPVFNLPPEVRLAGPVPPIELTLQPRPSLGGP
jgi:hypothetical protein